MRKSTYIVRGTGCLKVKNKDADRNKRILTWEKHNRKCKQFNKRKMYSLRLLDPFH